MLQHYLVQRYLLVPQNYYLLLKIHTSSFLSVADTDEELFNNISQIALYFLSFQALM